MTDSTLEEAANKALHAPRSVDCTSRDARSPVRFIVRLQVLTFAILALGGGGCYAGQPEDVDGYRVKIYESGALVRNQNEYRYIFYVDDRVIFDSRTRKYKERDLDASNDFQQLNNTESRLVDRLKLKGTHVLKLELLPRTEEEGASVATEDEPYKMRSYAVEINIDGPKRIELREGGGIYEPSISISDLTSTIGKSKYLFEYCYGAIAETSGDNVSVQISLDIVKPHPYARIQKFTQAIQTVFGMYELAYHGRSGEKGFIQLERASRRVNVATSKGIEMEYNETDFSSILEFSLTLIVDDEGYFEYATWSFVGDLDVDHSRTYHSSSHRLGYSSELFLQSAE